MQDAGANIGGNAEFCTQDFYNLNKNKFLVGGCFMQYKGNKKNAGNCAFFAI